jgi:flagellar M-ring protein FliF
MDSFLNSFRSFWQQLDVNQRVSLVGSSMFIVAAAIALFVWSQRPNMKLLYGSVATKDAAAIVENLDASGVPYELRAGGTAIYVPAEHVYKARMNVASQGLVQGDSVGFEIFDRGSFGISDFIQRTNFIRAIQGELSRTIAQLNGVRSARVMVVMPDSRLLLVNDDVKTTASVFVEVGGGALSTGAVRSIQSLVANAVEGLTNDNVAVVDNNGNVLSKKSSENDIMAGSTGVVEYRQQLEKYFSNKVESMLERVVGAGNVVVRVATEIDATRVSMMKEDFSDEGSVLREQKIREQVTTSMDREEAAAGGEAGEAAENGGGNSVSQTGDENAEREQRYEIDRTVTNTVQVPGRITRLTASVFIAKQTQPAAEVDGLPVVLDRTAEEMERLREMVANALGVSLEEAAAGSIVVQETTFGINSLLADLAQEEGFLDPVFLLNYGQEIIGGVIALVLFLVFLNQMKRTRGEKGLLDQMEEARLDARSRSEVTGQEAVTPAMLNELIRQKPDNISSNLKTWLSDNKAE